MGSERTKVQQKQGGTAVNDGAATSAMFIGAPTDTSAVSGGIRDACMYDGEATKDDGGGSSTTVSKHTVDSREGDRSLSKSSFEAEVGDVTTGNVTLTTGNVTLTTNLQEHRRISTRSTCAPT